jgi:hypothetical protein
MENDDLFDITLGILELIIDLYEKKKISYEVFVENSLKKIAYIKQYLETVQQDVSLRCFPGDNINLCKSKFTLLESKYLSLVKDPPVIF